MMMMMIIERRHLRSGLVEVYIFKIVKLALVLHFPYMRLSLRENHATTSLSRSSL